MPYRSFPWLTVLYASFVVILVVCYLLITK